MLSQEIMLRVAYADLMLGHGHCFSRSVDRRHREGPMNSTPWRTMPGGCGPLLIGERDGVVVNGDCTGGVSAPDGGVVHINGNLVSVIDAAGHYELVIAGDIGPQGVIEAASFCRVFVGGKFSGVLRSVDSASVWIESDFDGRIETGIPITSLYVGGDFRGDVLPRKCDVLPDLRPAGLEVVVAGFAAQETLHRIFDRGYVHFRASIGRSDIAPGFYPADGGHRQRNGGNSFNRWCVHRQADH